MNIRQFLKTALFLCIALFCPTAIYAENIDPNNDNSQYAYGENIGWINFEPNVPEPNVGATVTDANLSGFVWSENVGWINLSPNVPNDPNYYGVINDGAGSLSGYAWGENIGWINFGPNVLNDSNDYGVSIDTEGSFSGWAYGENVGWIHFYGLFKVNFDDLANFVAQWLKVDCDPGNDWCQGADMTAPNTVDFRDYSILASYWLDYCPTGWQLAPVEYKVETSWHTSP